MSSYVETDSFNRFYLFLFSIYLLEEGGVQEPSPISDIDENCNSKCTHLFPLGEGRGKASESLPGSISCYDSLVHLKLMS